MVSMTNDSSARIRETILQNMPREAEITRIEFEGPRLAVYVKNIDLLLNQGHIITDIVNIIHKRIVMRSDPSIRLPEEEARNEILKLIPPEAGISSMSFDPNLGEVLIEVKKPGIAIGKDGAIIQEIIREANTLGSKSPDYFISEGVVNIKVEVEKLREQVQNVE